MVLRTIEATVEKDGTVRLHEKLKLPAARRAILTILDEPIHVAETALLSEPALAEDWNRPEEDKAWAHLQDAVKSGLEFWNNPLVDEDWNTSKLGM
jgi:hypothetical protein